MCVSNHLISSLDKTFSLDFVYFPFDVLRAMLNAEVPETSEVGSICTLENVSLLLLLLSSLIMSSKSLTTLNMCVQYVCFQVWCDFHLFCFHS